MYCAKPIFKGVMFTSLEPICDLGVTHGMVCFSSLVFIILFLMHFLAIGVVIFLVIFLVILSPKYVGDFGSSSVLLAILFVSIN